MGSLPRTAAATMSWDGHTIPREFDSGVRRCNAFVHPWHRTSGKWNRLEYDCVVKPQTSRTLGPNQWERDSTFRFLFAPVKRDFHTFKNQVIHGTFLPGRTTFQAAQKGVRDFYNHSHKPIVLHFSLLTRIILQAISKMTRDGECLTSGVKTPDVPQAFRHG